MKPSQWTVVYTRYLKPALGWLVGWLDGWMVGWLVGRVGLGCGDKTEMGRAPMGITNHVR